MPSYEHVFIKKAIYEIDLERNSLPGPISKSDVEQSSKVDNKNPSNFMLVFIFSSFYYHQNRRIPCHKTMTGVTRISNTFRVDFQNETHMKVC